MCCEATRFTAAQRRYHCAVKRHASCDAKRRASRNGGNFKLTTLPLGGGGTRQGFPEANEMSFGGSLRSVTEGARATLNLY